MTDLKPCPFCGSEATGHQPELCYCTNDKCMMGEENLESDQWNTRPIEDELKRRLDIAVEALNFIGEMPTIAGNPSAVQAYVVVIAQQALKKLDQIG